MQTDSTSLVTMEIVTMAMDVAIHVHSMDQQKVSVIYEVQSMMLMREEMELFQTEPYVSIRLPSILQALSTIVQHIRGHGTVLIYHQERWVKVVL